MKNLWLVITLLILPPGIAGNSFAAGALENSVGLRFGAVHFENGSASEPDLQSHYPVLGITADTRWKQLGLQLSVDRIEANYEQTLLAVHHILPILVVGSVERVDTNLTIIPILLTAQLHFLAEPGAVDPYLGIGGGYYRIPRNSIPYDAPPQSPLQDFRAELDNAFGFHAGLGINIKLSDVLAFTVDTRYAVAKTNIHFKSSIGSLTPDVETLHLTGFVTTLGMKYYFTD